MRTLAKLFAKSPFAPLQKHMEDVNECVDKVKEIFEALEKNDSESIPRIAKEISKLEAKADTTKHELRNHLPSSLFMPISKGALLEILSLQDDIADDCEDIGILMTLKELKLKEVFKDDFKSFLNKNFETYDLIKEADLSQRKLLKNIFNNEDQFSHGEFQLWLLLMKEIKTLSNTSEKLAHRIRNLLDLE